MFDYTNNFPIIESQPEAGRLRFNAFIQTPEFLDSMQGVGKVADVNRWNDPTAWTTLGEDRESEVTSDEYRNGVKVLMASEGEFRGFLEDFAGFFGIDAFKDESKAKVVRGVFAGYDPNKPIQFRKSELTPEALKVASENMQLLMEAEKDKPVDPKNLTPNQKRIQEYAEKLIYAKSGEVAKTQLGFSPKGFLTDVAGDPLIDLVTNATGNDPADLSDVIELQTKIDPSFDSTAWFDKMTEDQTVKMGLLEYGISASTVAGAPNEDAARFLIGRQLAKNEIQERIARYSPTFMDEANILGTSALNDPDFIPGIALEVALIGAEVGLGVATGGASALATVPLRLGRGVALASKARSLLHAPGLINDFVRLKNVFGTSRTIAITKGTLETMAKLPLGMAPSYAKKLKLIGQVGAPFAIGATAGVLTEAFRQKSEIAYAAATLYSDPDAQREYDYEAIAWAGGVSGLFGATLFGLAPVLIGAGFGASLNRLKGLNLSKYGEEVIRDEFNKQWSLKGTMLGESLDSIPGIRKKTKTVIDGPVDEVAATKAELTGKPTSGEGIMADTTERVDRAETRAIDSPEKAETLPVENASKRYDNETKESYVTRVASNKLVTDIVSFVRELSKFVPDTADNLVLSSYDWTKMTAKDQIKALADSADWIKKAKEIESKSSGGLALDRAKVYDVMEQQRRKYIRNLAKTMTKDEYKALQKEMRGDRRVALPEALAAARRTSATTKEKQEAASEVAAQLIERAKEIAKDRDKAVRTREEVPAEVLKSFDAATTEASLTGRVSEETAAAIRANVMGVEPKAPRFSMVRQAIDTALLRKRLNPERMEKIRSVVENPRRFVELVEGNKEAARNYYNFVTQMKMKGLISADQRDLLLAATVHLNFDNKAFNIAYTFAPLRKNVAGEFNRDTNTLTISNVWTGSQETRTKTVLHELGHAFVAHKAKGDLYLDMLKLYNIPTSNLSFNTSNIHRVDSMLKMGFLTPYHLSNVEETFVQTFSEILFKETQLAVGSLDPIKVSLFQTVLNDIAESLVFAAEALNASKYYKVANELIDEMVKVNTLLDNQISVPRFVQKFAISVIDAPSVKEANSRLSKELQTDKYKIADNEWDLVTKMVESDPSFLVAYAILKTQGKSLKSQADYDFLVGAYAEYKTAQFNSLLYRVSFAISTEAEFFRKHTKEQRLAFIENYFFDVVDDNKIGTLNIQAAKLPTYEDYILNTLPSVETNDNYGRSYWLTTGNALRAELESRGINTDRFDRNTMLSKSVLENVQTYLSSLGLDEIANSLINVYHKRLIRNMTDGIFNMELPSWSSADIAKSALADMLQQKVDLPVVMAMLSRQVEPVLLQNLINLVDKVDLTPEKKTEDLLTGLYKAINDGAFHYNPTTGKWQSEIFKAPRKPKAKKTVTAARPEKPVEAKPVEEIEAEAGAADVVTPDNYLYHLTKLGEELDRGGLKSTKLEQDAIIVIGNMIINPNHSIVKMIMDGKITNIVDLRKALIKQGKNVVTDEGREYRRITETDVTTGEKATKKVLVQQGETAERKTKEGIVAGKLEKIEQDGLERENTQALIDQIEGVLQHIPDFVTPNERMLIDAYKQSPIQAKVAKIIGKSKATVSTWDTKLRSKLAIMFKEAGIDLEILKNPEELRTALLAWDKKQKEAAASAVKSKPSKKKVIEAETKEPAKVDPDPAEKGKRMAELSAKAAKLKNDNPTPVPTPVTTTEPTMARVTSEVTGNAPEEVLRPEKQADALIDGDVSATKELVTFTPKKPLQTTFNSSVELEANPEKMKSLMEAAARAGRDAIVFKDGSMIPVKAEPVVVGKTELRKPVGIETVTTVTVEKGVPVKRVAPKPKKSKVKGDGEPVRVTAKGEPKKPEPKVRESDVVKTEESERIERLVNEQKDTARANGLDSSFLKQLLSVYWKAMKELDKDSGVPYTPMFMRAWTKFVVINKEIMEANLKLVGKDGVAKFWDKVDQLRAIEQVKKVTVPGYTPRTDKAIFAEAAAEVSPKFIPFVTPRSLKLKAVDGDIVFTSKDKMIRSIVAENKAESPVPTPPTPAAAVSEEVPMSIKMPDTDDAELKEMDSILQEAIDTAENNASMPLRQSSLIGVIFGGSNRDSASFWERLMNWMVNTSQTASATGLTIRSMQHSIRFVSRLFDDTRAQTGHLAAAGKTAFKTAMQLKSDEKATINRIAKYQLRINKYLENLPTERNKLMLTIYRKLANGETIVEADIRAAGITDTGLITTLTKNSNELLKVVRQVNETILGLEAETGMVRSVDSMGNTIEAERFAPVQLNHEYISRLSPEQRKILVAKLIEARTQRKLESKILDINTLIAMGWLDVAPSADNRGTNIFAGDRKFRSGLGINTISQETKNKLRTGITYPIGADPNNILVDLANKGMPQEFFVLRENNVLNVYRMPKVIDDLGESDLIRYREAITGNTAMYHPRWKEYLKNKNLVEVEMEETLDFKTKSGRYSEFNSKTSSNIDRPLLRLGSDESIALAVPGLTPEEVLRFPEITAAMRTNLAESYFYFLNGRMFELLFQKELDRLLGRTGITPINLFDWLYKFNEENLNKLAKAENWTPDQLIARKQELALGIDRLREEYANNADTLPTIPNKQLYTARAGLAIMKMKVAPGYILSTMTEVLQEFLKSNPIELPANIINGIRHIFGDLRLSKSKLLEQDIGDLAFVADSVLRSETGDRLLGEVSHGAFELDNKLKTKFINSNTPMNRIDRTTMMLETGARVAESIGSLNAVTNWVRGMALTRWQRRVWEHISKGRIQKLLDVMETPNMRQLMDQLLLASQTNAIEERKLWKQFAAEARKAGFGFEPQEAMIFFRYGLNSKELIRHLKYLIENSNSDRSGRVNIDSMVDTYWREKRNPSKGIDPRILGDVLSAYRFMLDDLVIKTSSPEPTGLGRITRIDSKTSFGKLWYALTSWIRGYQDSVVLNYATQNTMQYLAKTIILFGTLDTITGLFREWVAGRETEDMVEEFTNSPSSFAIRVMKAAPIMGSANAVLEGLLSGLSYLSGGSWRYYGSPMSSIGVNAAGSATKDIFGGVTEIATQTSNAFSGTGEVEGPKVAKAIGDITMFNSLFNRSPVAVPARFVEDMEALDQKGAVQKYMNLIQREPYPYAKAQRKGPAGAPRGVTIAPEPRNLAKEQAQFAEARKKQEQLVRPVSSNINDQKGVSGRLGELLE